MVWDWSSGCKGIVEVAEMYLEEVKRLLIQVRLKTMGTNLLHKVRVVTLQICMKVGSSFKLV